MEKDIIIFDTPASNIDRQRNGTNVLDSHVLKSQRPPQPIENFMTSTPPHFHRPVQMVYPAIQRTPEDTPTQMETLSDSDTKDHDVSSDMDDDSKDELYIVDEVEDGRSGRRQRDFVPDRMKDSRYWVKRIKNNLAAKRSREKRRMADIVMEGKVCKLAQENEDLRSELANIKRMVQDSLAKEPKQKVARGDIAAIPPPQETPAQFVAGTSPQSIPLIIPTYPNSGTSIHSSPQEILMLSQSGLSQPGVLPPGMLQSGLSQPGVLQPGMLQSGLSQPGVLQPGLLQSGLPQPGLLQPCVPQSMLPQQGVPPAVLPQSGLSQHVLVQNGSSHHGLSQPGLPQPSLLQPAAPLSSLPQQVVPPQSGLPQHVLLQHLAPHSNLPRPGLPPPTVPQPNLAQPGLPKPMLLHTGIQRPGLPQQVQPVLQQRYDIQNARDTAKVSIAGSNVSRSNGPFSSFISPARTMNSVVRPERNNPRCPDPYSSSVAGSEIGASTQLSNAMQNSPVSSTDRTAAADNITIRNVRTLNPVSSVSPVGTVKVSERSLPLIDSPSPRSKAISKADDSDSMSSSMTSCDSPEAPSLAEINKLPHKLRARFLRSICHQNEHAEVKSLTDFEVSSPSNQSTVSNDPILINIKKEKEDEIPQVVDVTETKCPSAAPSEASTYNFIPPKPEFPLNHMFNIEEELEQAKRLMPTPNRAMNRNESQAYVELAKAASALVGAHLHSKDFSAPSVRQLTRQRTREMDQVEKYRDKRSRNNIAAKKCRDAKRLLTDYRLARSNFFEVENMTLRNELDGLTKDVLRLRELVRRKLITS